MRKLVAVYDYAILYLGLTWLGVLCLAWTPFAMVLNPILPDKWARPLGRWVIMAAFNLYIKSLSASRRVHFDISALDALRGEGPMIIAPNHPCILDAVMVISRLPNVACVMKTSLKRNIFLGAGSRLARYIGSEPLRGMMHSAVEDFQNGSHLLLFPEGTRTTQDPVNVFSGSIGIIANKGQVPVQTVLIETDSQYLRKGWPLFKKAPMPIAYRIRLGKRFDPPTNTQAFMTELHDYFANELVKGSAFHPTGSLGKSNAK